MGNTHSYPSYGSKSIKANVSGRGLVSPVEKTTSISVHEMMPVPAFSMSGSFSNQAAGTILTDNFPEANSNLARAEITGVVATLSIKAHLDLLYDGYMEQDGGVSAFVGFGTQRQYYNSGNFMAGIWGHIHATKGWRTEWDAGLGRSRNYITPSISCIPYGPTDAGLAVERVFPEMEMDYADGVYTLQWDYPLAEFTWRFLGTQYAPDYYYHYCTNKTIEWVSFPAGFEYIGTPTYDIPFANKAYLNVVDFIYQYTQIEAHTGGSSWEIGWGVSFPSWRYYR